MNTTHIPRSKQLVDSASTPMDQRGFALLEVIVALTIMAIVGLLAWRGMDAMIRGRDIIERRSQDDSAYIKLVHQFDRDCQEIVRQDEINFAATATNSSAVSAPGVTTSNGSGSVLPSIATSAKNIWWLRHYRADKEDAWLLVGYGVGANGLQRWTGQPLMRRADALALWAKIVRDPDLVSSALLVSWQLPNVVRQAFVIQSSLVNGAGGMGVSATGSATPPTSVGSTTTNNADANSNSKPTVTVISPSQQGLVMQWWMKEIALPITRSCLMGGSL